MSHESQAAVGTHSAGHGHAHANGHGHVGHIVPTKLLLGILIVLLVLTYVTYALRAIPLGALNIWVAMFIATIKGSLVVLYFMHLRWDRPFNGVIFVGSLLFVMLFVSLALTDTAQYKGTFFGGLAPDVKTTQAPIESREPAAPAAAPSHAP